MNIRFRDQQLNDETQNNYNPRTKMDVTNILEKYGDYDFGIVKFNQVHICSHKCYDQANEDYYLTLAKIEF